LIPSAVSPAVSPFLSRHRTAAPSLASRIAVARPIPWPAPVMNAPFPSNRIRSPLESLAGYCDAPARASQSRRGGLIHDGEHAALAARGESRARGALPALRRHGLVRAEQPVHDGPPPGDPERVLRADHPDLENRHGAG